MLNLRPARNAQRSIASLDAYRAAEAARAASKAGGDAPAEPVAVGRTLSHSASFDVEYEALALRVAPPEITVDNRSRADATLITVDSANRAGTLLAVAQFLTQKRLNVKSARITSDFGWFYDGERVCGGGWWGETGRRWEGLCRRASGQNFGARPSLHGPDIAPFSNLRPPHSPLAHSL